jgi:hypothetical protein
MEKNDAGAPSELPGNVGREGVRPVAKLRLKLPSNKAAIQADLRY